MDIKQLIEAYKKLGLDENIPIYNYAVLYLNSAGEIFAGNTFDTLEEAQEQFDKIEKAGIKSLKDETARVELARLVKQPLENGTTSLVAADQIIKILK